MDFPADCPGSLSTVNITAGGKTFTAGIYGWSGGECSLAHTLYLATDDAELAAEFDPMGYWEPKAALEVHFTWAEFAAGNWLEPGMVSGYDWLEPRMPDNVSGTADLTAIDVAAWPSDVPEDPWPHMAGTINVTLPGGEVATGTFDVPLCVARVLLCP